MNSFCRLIASLFYIGYLPIAPGSIGSLAAVFLYYFIRDNPLLMGLGIIASIVLGFLTAGRAERIFGRKDPGEIVIDEFAGMLVSLYLLPARMGYVIAAFLVFRFFDVAKPWPIAGIERKEGSLGIMGDDLMAGVYANLILQGVRYLF